MKRIASLLVACAACVSTLFASGTGKGKVLTLIKDSDLSSMDPQIASDGLSFEVIATTMEGLYSTAANGSAQPALAKKTEVSKDGLKYTFTLRDAKWSNGTPVTAKDFVYAWRRLVNPKMASDYAFMMGIAGVKNADACAAGKKPVTDLGVSAPNDRTFVVDLERVVPFFPSLLSFPSFYPANQAFVESKGDQYALTPEATLSCGPFKLNDWYHGSSFKVVRNASYWDSGAIKLDAINFKVVLDSQSAVLEYESHAADYVRLTGELVERYRNRKDFTSTLGSYLWYLSVNLKKGDLKNMNLDNAIAYAFDRGKIANLVLRDSSRPANYFVPAALATGPDGKDFRATAPKYYTEGKAKAREYWTKAKAELGKSAEKIELLYEDSEASKKVAEFLKAEIETTLDGITIDLKSQPKKTRLKLMQGGEYEIGLTRWGPDYQDPMTYLDLFVTGGAMNFGGYSDPEYDKLVELCTSGKLSLKDRWETMKKAEGVLLKGGGPIPVYQTGASMLWNPKASGYINNAVGVPFTYKYADIKD